MNRRKRSLKKSEDLALVKKLIEMKPNVNSVLMHENLELELVNTVMDIFLNDVNQK